MQRGRRFWFTAAATVLLAAVLAWWLARDRDASEQSTRADESASASNSSSGEQRRALPEFDLVQARKAAISGTIRSLDGQPIADAQVCAVSSVRERQGIDDRKPHCVRSGPDGYYRIDALLPIKTEVHAGAASFKPNLWERRERGVTRTHVPLRAGETTKDIDITLAPGGVLITGVVRDIAGGEIEEAQVMVGSDVPGASRILAFGLSGPEGRFELWTAPGTLRVAAEADGYAVASVPAVAPGEFIELFLTPESVLVGTVVLASSGEPVEGAVVSTFSFLGGRQYARTDESGRFRVDRLQPGTYKPTVESDDLYGEAAEQVHLGLGETSDEIVIRVHPAAHVEGTVVIAGTERTCSDGSVRIERSQSDSKNARIDEEGHVEFRAVLAGEYRVFVSCTGHLSEDEYEKLVIGEQSIGDLVWEVREGLAIRGEVVDEAGQPLANVQVYAQQIVDPEAARSQTTSTSQRSESDGRFELAGLLPGRYEVSASSWRGRPGPLEPITVELASGTDVNDVRLVMPAVGSIHGRVIDETGKSVSGVQLVASSLGDQGQNEARSNDAGEFTIENLRPGRTRVTASSGESWWSGTTLRKPGTTDDDLQGEVVEVLANETVEVVLTVAARNGRITGVVKDEHGGPVADAFIDVERMSDKAGANPARARRGVRWGGDTKPVLTDADGRFAVEELPDGNFIVCANRKGGGQALLEDVALGSHIELVIASTGELAGTVKLAGGGTPERFTISIEDNAAGLAMGDSYFRTGGIWRIGEVPAGKFKISASASEGNVTLETPIELGEGELHENIELELAPQLTVRGRIIDLETGEPVAGLEVHASGRRSFTINRGGGERLNVTGPDGRFEVKDVPVGQVNLMVWSRGGGSETKHESLYHPLTLASEPLVQDIGDLEVVPKRLDATQKGGDLGYTLHEWDLSAEPSEFKATVASVRPGGPADGSGLAVGDVIEKVDGHDVTGNNTSRYYPLTRVAEGTKITLGLSGDKTVEIIAGPPLQ
jgi:protocatechuate 3,4-dioxygenase beta subunit